MKKLSTKKALLFSALAMVLCVSMLVGTTFAWFTDTASTNVNKIQAGELKVDIVNADGESLAGETLNFVKANAGTESTSSGSDGETTEEEILWEPGCTYELEKFYIKNNGNLAIKYTVVISGINGDDELSDALVWNYDFPTDATLAPGATSEAITISAHMKEDAGNEYQGKSIEGISVTVYATQAVYEYDSNGNDYDASAPADIWDGTTVTAPTLDEDGVYHITNAAEFAQYINTFSDLVAPSFRGEYYDAKVVLDCDIDYNGNTIERSSASYFYGQFDGQNHTISNFTMKHTDVDGFTSLFGAFDSANTCVKNLTIKDATVIGGEQTALIGTVYSGTIDNCRVYNSTIAGEKKVGAIAAYVQSNGTIKNCVAENCDIYCSDTRNDQVTLFGFNNGGTFTNNTNKGGNTLNYNATVTAVSTAAALKTALENGGYIILTDDINVNNAWTTVSLSNKNLNLNGNGHKITNLNAPLINFYGGNCTVNNLTVASSNVVDNSGDCLGSGIILNRAEWANLYMNNCHVKNSTLNVGRDTRTGALVGYWIGGGEIKNCTVDNVDITNNGGTVGGIVDHRQNQGGYEAEAKITNCTVTNCELKTTDSDWRVGAIIGTVNAGATTLTNCTESGNTLTQTGVTDPGHSLYGRTASGGTITIN